MMIRIPPLRDRGEDKLLLAKYFLLKFTEDYNSGVVNFDGTATAAIDSYRWPGNVRELMGKVKNAVIMADGKFVTALDLGLEEVGELALNLKYVREAAERTAIQKALSISSGKITAAAKLLGVTRPTLYDLFKRHGIKNGEQPESTDVIERSVSND
jgi:two-component system NtrC family response regulator